MKLSFEIVPYITEENLKYGGMLYSLKINGDSVCELDKFLLNPMAQKEPEYADLKGDLFYLADFAGFKNAEDIFKRKESKITNTISAFHFHGRLRLYCMWASTHLIVGNGCIKPEDKHRYQDVETCNDAVNKLERFDKLYFNSIQDKFTKISKAFAPIEGDILFEEL